MQLSFAQKEQFFHELGQLARSGISLPASLEMLSRSRRRHGRFAKKAFDDLKITNSASEAFLGAGFPASDAAVIEAGESAGHLDQVFDELEIYYRQLAQARSRIILRSTYSVIVLHAGAILLAIAPAILAKSWEVFFKNSLSVLLVFYGVLLLVYFIWKFIRAALAKSVPAARLITAMPLLGTMLSNLTAWKFSLVLSLYVKAGGRVLKGLELAGASCGNALLDSASRQAIPRVQAGETLTATFCAHPGLPELLERSVEVGERSGRLDEETRRAANLYKERTLASLDKLARSLPVAIYIGVVIYTAFSVIGAMQSYWSSAMSILDE